MKLIRIFFICILSIITLSFKNSETRHIGKWSGKDKDKLGSLILDEEGYATLIVDGRTIGGKESSKMSNKFQLTYFVDYHKKPIEIDFVMTNKDTKIIAGKLLGLITFEDKDKMRICLGFKEVGKRPQNFDDEESVTLEKEK